MGGAQDSQERQGPTMPRMTVFPVPPQSPRAMNAPALLKKVLNSVLEFSDYAIAGLIGSLIVRVQHSISTNGSAVAAWPRNGSSKLLRHALCCSQADTFQVIVSKSSTSNLIVIIVVPGRSPTPLIAPSLLNRLSALGRDSQCRTLPRVS